MSAATGEDLLRAVAVMHVPVEDGDPLPTGPATDRGDRDRDIVQEAKALPSLAAGVVARRAGGGKGHRRFPGPHRLDGRECHPGRDPCRMPRAGHDVGIGVQPSAAIGVPCRQPIEVRAVVDASCLVDRDRLRAALDERRRGRTRAVADALCHRVSSLGPLGMPRHGVRAMSRIGQQQDDGLIGGRRVLGHPVRRRHLALGPLPRSRRWSGPDDDQRRLEQAVHEQCQDDHRERVAPRRGHRGHDGDDQDRPATTRSQPARRDDAQPREHEQDDRKLEHEPEHDEQGGDEPDVLLEDREWLDALAREAVQERESQGQDEIADDHAKGEEQRPRRPGTARACAAPRAGGRGSRTCRART